MKRFPHELSDLLSPAGLRLLAGNHALKGALAVPGTQFATLKRALDPRQARADYALLQAKLLPAMEPMETPIPPEALYGMTKNYSEVLPKVLRCKTAYLEQRRERAFAEADRIGLVRMLRSESFRALATTLAGRPLRKKFGQQVICYSAGDYQGPHNDHHPEEPLARDGYIDVHFSLALPGQAQQHLVYAKKGHLSEVASVAELGALTAYRLPFWHHTTPLLAKRPGANRWLLLGTFLFA